MELAGVGFITLVLLFLLVAIASLCFWVFHKVSTVSIEPALCDHSSSSDSGDGDRDAILAASFNPLHNGHMMLLRSIAARHPRGTVYAVVGHNPSKVYDVNPQERCALLTMAIARDPELSKNVKAVVVQGYIWRFAFKLDKGRHAQTSAEHSSTRARSTGGALLYRGIRSISKDLADERFLHVLNLVGPVMLGPLMAPPQTRFLTAPEDDAVLFGVSSSEVRKRAAAGSSLDGLVPDVVKDQVARLYSR